MDKRRGIYYNGHGPEGSNPYRGGLNNALCVQHVRLGL